MSHRPLHLSAPPGVIGIFYRDSTDTFNREFLQERSRVAAPVPLLFIGSGRACRQWPAISPVTSCPSFAAFSQHILPAHRNRPVADVIRCHSRVSQYPPSTDRGGGARRPSHMRDTSCNAASPVRTPLAVPPGSAEPDATEPMCFAYKCFAYKCFAYPSSHPVLTQLTPARTCSHLLKCAQARACSTTPGPTLRTKPTGYNPPASSSAGCQL